LFLGDNDNGGSRMTDDAVCFSPSDFVQHEVQVRRVKKRGPWIPSKLVMVYSLRSFRYLQRLTHSHFAQCWYSMQRPLHVGEYGGTQVSLLCNCIGASAASMMFEEVIAFGAREVVEVGVAGGIQPFLKPGDMFVATGAERDEGTSSHYFPARVELECSNAIRRKIEGYFSKRGIMYHKGPVWTTDAPYRETIVKFHRFKKKGVLGVNMETSALLAVARYRRVRFSSIQVVSDVLSDHGWLIAFGSKQVQRSTNLAMKGALEALTLLPPKHLMHAQKKIC
jgi:uridine phosphorylase